LSGAEFTNSPRHLAKLNLLVPFLDDKVSLGLELQYVSAVRVNDSEDARGYLLTNATLFTQHIVNNLEASFSIYNLFDQRYRYPAGPNFLEETLPAEGRSFRVKATY